MNGKIEDGHRRKLSMGDDLVDALLYFHRRSANAFRSAGNEDPYVTPQQGWKRFGPGYKALFRKLEARGLATHIPPDGGGWETWVVTKAGNEVGRDIELERARDRNAKHPKSRGKTCEESEK